MKKSIIHCCFFIVLVRWLLGTLVAGVSKLSLLG